MIVPLLRQTIARHALLCFALVAMVLHSPCSDAAAEFELSGSASLELRYFPQSGQWAGQESHLQPSLLVEPDLTWRIGSWKAFINPFVRLDGMDTERTHFDLREAYIRWNGSRNTVRVGSGKVFWGVTESRHLVDIINQWDAVEDIDQEDKLGQPMIEWIHASDIGDFSFYYLPIFRERSFAGRSGRYRLPKRVRTDEVIIDGKHEEHLTHDVAARYAHYFGSWDLGLSIFHGISRAPRFLPDPSDQGFIPTYDRITTLSGDIQRTGDNLLLKLEVAYENTPYDSYIAAVAGLEYTLFQISESSADLGLILEMQYDGRSENAALVAPVIEDNDVFVGARLALNDPMDTSVLLGLSQDIEKRSTYGMLEAERRINPDWTFEVEGRFIIQADQDEPLFFMRRDTSMTLRLNRHF